jgi:hypothetical protein
MGRMFSLLILHGGTAEICVYRICLKFVEVEFLLDELISFAKTNWRVYKKIIFRLRDA